MPDDDNSAKQSSAVTGSYRHASGMHGGLALADADTQIFQAGEAWTELAKLIDAGDSPGVLRGVQNLPLASTAATIMNLGQPRLGPLWTMLVAEDIEFAADLLEHFADWQGASILAQLPPETAAQLVMRMDSDDQIDVLAKTGRAGAERILAALDPADAAQVRERLHYSEDTAGRVMVTEIITFPAELRVDDVIRHVRQEHQHYRQHELRYIFLYSKDLRLFGVVPLTSLLIAEENTLLQELIIEDFPVVDVHAPLDLLEDAFDRHDHYSLPVIDGRGRLVGAVQRASVFEALRERAEERLLEAAGIFGGEELRTMPLRNRIFRRLSFLLPSVVLSYAAVSVISFFEPVIAEITALAIFLPMVANLSGAAGNQSVAVSIRELSLAWSAAEILFRYG